MTLKAAFLMIFFSAFGLAGCTNTAEPGESFERRTFVDDGDLRVAALDYQIGDLSDPAVMAKYSRVDLLIVSCDQFWGRSDFAGRIDLLRAANPDIKILGYFRVQFVRPDWGDIPREMQSYNYDLCQASRPYWAQTTQGDTVSDWPGTAVFDFTNAAARKAMLDVFVEYQTTSDNQFDGVFWDYFSYSLWIAPQVTGMEGDPDLDADGVSHWDDEDELEAFRDGQDAWVFEMERAMGSDFIQVGNGVRALRDSVFAGNLDGMLYEMFPAVGFSGDTKYAQALDLNYFNNLWAANRWPRKSNGGPWLILSPYPGSTSYWDNSGNRVVVDPGDLNRAVALLTDATSIHYSNIGFLRAGVPDVEFDLGKPLGATTVEGQLFVREFERGRVELEMGSGDYPVPFSYSVTQEDRIVEMLESPQ